MKIFVVADVHGFYNEMKQALDQAGFDPSNENHMLVSLGDIVDRGNQPVETLEYLMSLPRKILIRGNHEDLAEEIMRTNSLNYYDITNGTFDTFRLFAAHQKGYSISRDLAMFDWDDVVMRVRHYGLWREYLRECVDYFETKNHVFVHGWIPVTDGNWRDTADAEDWENARWAKSPRLAQAQKWDVQGKKIVCGHWHASDFHHIFDGVVSDAPYYHKHFIACDACTARSGFCNVVVIEDERMEDLCEID